jgi:hypothetical protein
MLSERDKILIKKGSKNNEEKIKFIVVSRLPFYQ